MVKIIVGTATAPAHWASALINGDRSGLDAGEIAALDAWLARIRPAYVVDVERDESGEATESRFTRHYDLYGGTARSGDVLDYVTHEILSHNSRFRVVRRLTPVLISI